jgi:hypothetical protein
LWVVVVELVLQAQHKLVVAAFAVDTAEGIVDHKVVGGTAAAEGTVGDTVEGIVAVVRIVGRDIVGLDNWSKVGSDIVEGIVQEDIVGLDKHQEGVVEAGV